MKKSTFLFRQTVTVALTALLLASKVQAGNLASIVNTNTINTSETVTLTVKYDEQVKSSSLNLDGLKKDFEILGVRPQSSSSTSISNGQVNNDESTVWKVTLAAKRQGKLTIPSFSVNGDLSQEIVIDVNDNNNTAAQKELQISVSTGSDSAYESQQLILNLELTVAQGLSGLGLSEIDIDGAEVKELGQQSDQRIDNGVIRNFITVRYALFPTRSGTITIPEITLTATKGRQRNFWGDVGGQRVITRSTAFDVTIKPMDKTYSPWFPAKEVIIDSKWSGNTNSVVAGEPITRTLTISALGQEASAIPPLQRLTENGFKSYKDQASLDDKLTYKGFIGQRIESEAIVVSSPGKLTLPAITMKWWDTQNGVWKDAIVPEKTLTVLPGKSTTQDTNNVVSQTPLSTANPTTTVVETRYKTHWLWPFISALLLALCFLQAYFLWKQKRSNNDEIQAPKSNNNVSETQAWSQLQQTMKQDNLKLTRKALHGWAKSLSTDNKPQSITSIVKYLEDESLKSQLTNSITELESCLYKEQSAFDTNTLNEQLIALRSTIQKKHKSKANLNELAPLYNN